ncbi:MAG: glycoside hydrolase family 16 protein [Bacteroidetes bacterium]|nr:glycoside hydrolase family 16 protein [Bacteroidota bacterium]
MRILLLLPAAFLYFACSDPQKDTPVTGLVPDGYTLVWQDEFSGSEPDLSKWSYETGTGVNGDFGTGQLDRATSRPENISVLTGISGADGGCLAITLRKEVYLDRTYTSGRLTTSGKGAWGPGYRIEARIKPDGIRYKGQGFAFWMMPAEKPPGQPAVMWPQGGEVDIMEYVGSIPFHNLGSVHYAWQYLENQYADWNHGHQGAYFSFSSGDVPVTAPGWGGYPVTGENASAGSQGWHRYAVDWFADRMEFLVDEKVYHIHWFEDGSGFPGKDGQDKTELKTVSGRRILVSEYSHHFAEWKPFAHTFYLILSAGVGGSDQKTYGGAITADAVFPASVYVDWVRVAKRN